MSSAAVSSQAAIEPGQQQSSSVSPNPASTPLPWQTTLADNHSQPVVLASPQPNGFDPLGLGPPQQPRSSSAGSFTRSPSQADSQGPVSGPPPVAAPINGLPSAVSSDGNVAHSSPRTQHAPSVSTPGRFSGALRSPKSAHAALETTSEYHGLAEAIKRTSPQIVRQVVRDLWEKCLLGSEYHLAFLSYTTIHRASSSTLDRAVQDFGERMVKSSKRHIMAHLSAEDFDEVADTILAQVSNEFLDKAMARRLETIRARQLVNALARAERLGYDVQDIVEEKTANGAEHVVPSLAPVPRRQVSGAQSSQASRDASAPPPKSTNPHGIVHCTKCARPCSGEQALRYHTTRRACEYTRMVERVGKDICPHCGCLFVSSGGLTYHVKSKVCGDYPEATEKMVVAQVYANGARSSPVSEAAPSVPTGTPASSQHKTPGQMVAAATGGSGPLSRVTPSRGAASPAEDPYAKLGPEERRVFEREMKMAEDKYGGLMREAMKLPAAERESELVRLKNSYNTKQSVTRKKYGIRLRERRPKADIDSERIRLFGTLQSDAPAPSPKRPRLSEGPAASREPESRPATALSGLSGGLAGSSGPAEHTDPTTLLTPLEPRSIAHVQAQLSTSKGTPDDPMQIDDDSSDETDSDSDSDDIPANLPARTA
ncbi:uncharacterized protein HRG_02624 [Hirsutella rhossiliensis]|uniref:Uncharacterized protein n=1 Tax=Hirsutella rhossiliensis TaxID=111463 RepID=A0A9P8N5B8_9HYPO|nr:uncharacterized protein HRG_02624 [Hirsutella rhossiliensis]KAH0967215.1 hypothetical protein HRG_02624 [Hirsutella rhossiliensis]